MSLLTPDITRHIGTSLPPFDFEVNRNDIRKYAIATGQRNPRFLSGDEAPLLFLFSAMIPRTPLEQLRPDGHHPDNPLIPVLPLKRIMAGGSEFQVLGRIMGGETLTVRQRILDIHEKEGASGPLIFLILENRYERQDGSPVVIEKLTRIAR
ncbi:MaoC family dehydratase N-terminal domain-containing protein [Kerstersia gyiorum]|uniref:FAS1-like dehydratase domain-containing protein n=1 Tax=Kerstersia gyiorum TaxID=206506 RepID=UPI0039E757BC